MIELGIWSILGYIVGAIIGIIPGAGPFVAVTLAYPFLSVTDPINILAFYVSVLITTNFTNSVTGILYGIPGDAAAIITAREGNKLYRKGYGHLAVSSNSISSTIGVFFAIALFLLFLPNILQLFKFYNSIFQTVFLFLALFIVVMLSKQSKIVTVLLFVVGAFLAKIGIDETTYESFSTFGNQYLSLGIPFGAIMIGLYIVPELSKIQNLGIGKQKTIIKFGTDKRIIIPAILGSFIGFWAGLVPGVTNILGSYASGILVKRYFKLPVLKAISAAEAANNSGALSSLLPLLILAIPITGSEVVIYYLMLDHGFVFSTNAVIENFKPILYIIPFITLLCMWTSWQGFNLFGRVAYFYKEHRIKINIAIVTIISLMSIFIYPIKIWMIICISFLMILGYFLKRFDTTPIIYGFFITDLFHDSLIRALIIIS